MKSRTAEYQKQYRLKNLDKDKAAKRRYYEKTKDKFRERERKWRKENPERVYENSLKYRYNIDLKQYKKMLTEQDNKCKLCASEEKLFVDHCHQTNKVRGLLCNSCNKALGLFYDNTETLQKALTYIKEHDANLALEK
jgi:hypothetical protein